MMSSFVFILYVLLAFQIGVCITLVGGLGLLRLIVQSPVVVSRFPHMITLLLLLVMHMNSLSKCASKPLLHNCLIDSSALLCNSGKMWPRHASIGSSGMSSKAVWVDQMMTPLGRVLLVCRCWFFVCWCMGY